MIDHLNRAARKVLTFTKENGTKHMIASTSNRALATATLNAVETLAYKEVRSSSYAEPRATSRSPKVHRCLFT